MGSNVYTTMTFIAAAALLIGVVYMWLKVTEITGSAVPWF